MKHNHLLLFFMFFMGTYTVWAQETFPTNGPKDDRMNLYAITGATIQLDPQNQISKATLLIKGEKILEVGQNVSIPPEAVQIDMSGYFIYPSFIDLHTDYGIPEAKPSRPSRQGEQILPAHKGAYNANDAIKCDFKAAEAFNYDEKTAKEMRKQGFGAVLTFRQDGIARGTSSLVSLADGPENQSVLMADAGAHYSLSRGSSRQLYPSSKMGFLALLRQTFLDAEWYKAHKSETFYDNTLEAWNAQQGLPQFMSVQSGLDVLRADKIGDEFGVQYIIKGGGDEYQQLPAIQKSGASLILPLNFPAAYSVNDPYEALRISLEDMMHWEQAPANPARLEKAGVNFAFTTSGLKKKSAFLKNWRKAIQYGLSQEKALAALTTQAAQLIQADKILGRLQKGYLANFMVCSDNIFSKKSKIIENWIQGKQYLIQSHPSKDYRGNYALVIGSQKYLLQVKGEAFVQKIQVMYQDSTQLKGKGMVENDLIQIQFDPDTSKSSKKQLVRLSGWIQDQKAGGTAQMIDGSWQDWSATFQGALRAPDTGGKTRKKRPDDPMKEPQYGSVPFPFSAYGHETIPQTETILFKNATVWTNEAQGILENADVLVKDGKITKVGTGLSAGNARVIDAQGRHLTSGIIDEHSHIALSSVNDRATVSAMVRMEDVVLPDDVDIYRQLAGGVTASQLLHGSANPVGGQSALIKMRWGMPAQDLLIKNADGYIKFALGENVKGSRRANSSRYPRTRMGVEQVYDDAFTQALAYEAAWKAYNASPQNNPRPRKILEMDALVEILNGKRFITCHSYVQSEINMLMKLAEKYDFRVNTFTHILEGYKLADKMKDHGVGASTFSDWWAYKFEVYDAIPYNPALMYEQGVVVAINSDDAEMGRRLNQEAAKAVKYGGVPEEDAWKMVTLNPAKLLHLENRTGSIKVGKDADLVLWTDHPLSIYAKAEKTMVDGVIYFDLEEDKKKQEWVAKERNRLIQKMQQSIGRGGAAAQAPPSFGGFNWHCEDVFIEK